MTPADSSSLPQRRIGVLGLGYVGLPLAAAFARRFEDVVGYDRDARRVRELRDGIDRTRSLGASLEGLPLRVTDQTEALAGRDLFVIAVPTPIDAARRPDLGALDAAIDTVARVLQPGGIVVIESTVHPGLTEERCGARLQEETGLVPGRDFGLAYAPERINPGDPEHTLERNVKLVAASDPETLEVVRGCYEAIVPAGVHATSSIRVAEAAKVIENVQRDLNIALMNELAVLFERLDLSTHEVLEAAATKWNFQRFHPGLVGGHCIGVDPYYLTALAQSVGLHPRVVLAGRRVNDDMGRFVAQKTAKLLAGAGVELRGARVAILGLAFKPDVPDARNSQVPGFARELQSFGPRCLCHDPLVAHDVDEEGLELLDEEGLAQALRDGPLDGLVLATPHAELLPLARELCLGPDAPRVCVDVLGALDPAELARDLCYWRP